MAFLIPNSGSFLLIACILLLVLPSPAVAFGAGNIPSISNIEDKNFRHGDIEDMLKTVAFIKGHKWTSMMIKRVYFGNWLRDYSQAVDVGSLKGVSAPTIRILVWVLSFLSFGYATAEFEVTEERLGVYRPEEHIDNPKGYADNEDARTFDPRLRGPINPIELEIDPNSGMKNYIANESGGWATSAGYVKFSFARSIHFGRLYTSGSHGKGKEEDLCEALRCLGQALHCMEDFGAHTNYCELALRELGYRDVFPHCGVNAEINIRGHHVYPLVTGTFGAVDFLHSVLGEATDHFTQTEVEEMDLALGGAQKAQQSGGGGGGGDGQRGLFGSGSSGTDFAGLLAQIPGMGSGLASTARDLQAQSAAQEYQNSNQQTRASGNTFNAPPGSTGGPPGPGVPGMSPDFDAVATAKKIYPILEFRDKIVRAINNTIAKIPGLESLVERISETLTVFILSLLAPFVRPIIDAVSDSLKKGSSTVVEASANSQFEPWNDPHCTDPTHSMLSKDHFSNILNSCAGRVASTILQYVTPRILYAWQNPGVPVDEVMNDILRTFHHPALRDEHVEIHKNMFNTVKDWINEQPNAQGLNHLLNSESVKAGRNHTGSDQHDHNHGSLGGHGKTSGSIWSEIKTRDLGAMEGLDTKPSYINPSPLPGSPGRQHGTPNYGYGNTGPSQPPQGGNAYLEPSYQQQGGYASQQQPPYQQYGGYEQQQQQPYSQQYGGPSQNSYEQGPREYWNQGPPSGQWGQQGPPPPDPWGQGPPQNQYPPQQGYSGQQYPPQQPPYGGQGGYQYPPSGGGYGGY
ncbi:hypothetical protein BCON_0170g00230 [Botryotinia convoluta]|uniref:Uncharacterized protein n=1 Tax=Botryotinia convoluta TaxID=54673 RepID=A0A4Z1HQ78_9HELO|nr:hypothetical protein BCON_0170g00230 [Botryotinia convoluta]